MLDIQHRLHVGSTIAGEKLIGPAQRMRRQDDVVQLQDRIVGIGRLLRKNVEPSAGDAALLKCCG